MLRLCLGVLLSAASLHDAHARLGQSWQPFLVRLWKEHSKNASNATAHQDHGYGYFVGAITVGKPHPQEMHVAFTTSAGLFVLPSSSCNTSSCRRHRRYDPNISTASVDIQMDGRPVDPAGGPRAPPGVRRDWASLDFAASDANSEGGLQGWMVQDVACLGDRSTAASSSATGDDTSLCAKVTVVVAERMDENTFSSLPEDGMVGLGLKALSPEPHLNFISRLGAHGLRSQFGLFVADDAASAELTFGGFDSGRMESTIQWTPVADPSLGHWTVDIVGVSVAGKALSLCGGGKPCRAFVHTSSPRMLVPKALAPELLDQLKSQEPSTCALPEVAFRLAGRAGVELVLRAEDYAGPGCKPEVDTHPMGQDIAGGVDLLVFGEPLLRRYYTVFDWKEEQIGFAPAVVERSCPRLARAGIVAAGCGGSSDEDEPLALLSSHPERQEA